MSGEECRPSVYLAVDSDLWEVCCSCGWTSAQLFDTRRRADASARFHASPVPRPKRRPSLPDPAGHVRRCGVSLHVVVPGTPQGQGRISTYGPRMTAYSNAKVLLPWRQTVAAHVREAMTAAGGTWPLRGPVALTVRFYVPRPRSVRRELPCVRPDLSHFVRAVEDSITASGAWSDDGQVVRCLSAKEYPQAGHRFHMDVPGCVIDISEVTP